MTQVYGLECIRSMCNMSLDKLAIPFTPHRSHLKPFSSINNPPELPAFPDLSDSSDLPEASSELSELTASPEPELPSPELLLCPDPVLILNRELLADPEQ